MGAGSSALDRFEYSACLKAVCEALCLLPRDDSCISEVRGREGVGQVFGDELRQIPDRSEQMRFDDGLERAVFRSKAPSTPICPGISPLVFRDFDEYNFELEIRMVEHSRDTHEFIEE